MSIINFAIAKPLEKKINQTIKSQGFASKAEFFRFAAMRYIEEQNENHPSFAAAADSLATAIQKKYRGKKLPSLEQQFADLM